MVWWEQVRILGITNKEPSGLHLCWSASGIAFVTAASVVTVEMAAQSIAAQEDAFIGVFINDEKQFRQKIRAVPGKKIYNLPAGISRNRQDPIGETDGRTIWQCVDHKSYYGCPGAGYTLYEKHSSRNFSLYTKRSSRSDRV